MAQISITVGQKNGSTFGVCVNEDGTMLSLAAEYHLEVLGEPFTYSKDSLNIHADDLADLSALADAIKAAVEARMAEARPIESDESYKASVALLEQRGA